MNEQPPPGSPPDWPPDPPRSAVVGMERLLEDQVKHAIVLALDAGEWIGVQDLQRAIGVRSRATLNDHLRPLLELRVVQRRVRNHRTAYALTPVGGRLTLDALMRTRIWLGRLPGGPIELASPEASLALGRLREAWASGVMIHLRERPCSKKELLVRIPGLISRWDPDGLLNRLVEVGIVGRERRAGYPNLYVLAEAGACGIGPLAAAAYLERVLAPEESAPVLVDHVEAAMIILAPLIELRRKDSGTCMLAISAEHGSDPRGSGGVHMVLEGGRVVACACGRPAGDIVGFAGGPVEPWFRAVYLDQPEGLTIRGSGAGGGLVRALVRAMHRVLYGP